MKITIEGVKYDHDFNKDVLIDQTQLEEEFSTQAEKYAFYAFLAARARAAYEHNKFALEQIEAALDHEKRSGHEQVKMQNAKHKYTEKMIEGEVITDKRFKDKKKEVLDARLLSEQLDKAAGAIAQRKDMLIQLGLGARIGNAPARVVDQHADAAHDVIAANKESKRRPSRRQPRPAQ